jgi:hypothetical protein
LIGDAKPTKRQLSSEVIIRTNLLVLKISAKTTDLLNQKQKGKTKANENDHVN